MAANTELKILSDSGSTFKVGGYGVVFGGRDLTGDRFTAKTDFWLDKIGTTPMVLYQHGRDDTIKRTVVGKVTSTRVDDVGLWVEAQITAAKQYATAIRELVAKGVLGWSSGSVPHLVERVKSSVRGVAEITSWPIVELSLTPTPAEPRTLGVRELKALAAMDPRLMPRIARKAAGGTSLQEASYEDLQGDLRDAAAEALGVPFVQVCATYSDHVIVSVESDMDAPGQPEDEEDSAYWDFPYTMGPDGEPVIGKPVPVQQAFVPGAAKVPLSTDRRNNLSNSQFAYVDSDGAGHLPINDAAHVRAAMSRFNQTSFESPVKKKAAARKILAKARSLNIDVSSDSAIAMAAKSGGPVLDQLPDSAFARVDKGDTIIEGKTYPLERRHYPHHDENGVVDPDSLADLVKSASDANEPAGVIAHLLRHQHAAATGTKDDAHSHIWRDTAAAKLLATGVKAIALAEAMAEDQLAMERTGIESKSGARIIAQRRLDVKGIHTTIGHLIENADSIERGDDGTAQVDLYRAAFDLLELEEVA